MKRVKKEKELFKVPKNVQDTIPVKRIRKNGIFLVGNNKYNKVYKFNDINYAVSSRSDKETIFLKYSELLNSFDCSATYQLVIVNKKLNQLDFENNVLLVKAKDKLNKYRDEYNSMLKDKAANTNSMIQEKYITVSIDKPNLEEAKVFFSRIEVEFNNHFRDLGSKVQVLTSVDRIKQLHEFYRSKETNIFNFDMLDSMRKGHSFKDYICPNTMTFEKDYFEFDGKFGRVLFLKEYANYIKDDMVSEITDVDKNIILSINIFPKSMEEAIRLGENRRLGVETNITNWQRRQNSNNNFSAVIPYDLEQQREESKEFLNDITTRDQRMFLCIVGIVHIADSLEQLNRDTENIISIGNQHMCQIGILKYQQLDGLNTVLPYGVNKINTLRTLTTESLAVFMPFRVQDINHAKGIYYGENVISKNMIIADRKQLLNGNSFILGVSGSGKSFTAKNEIVSIALRDPDADIIIIDPEREYSSLVNAMGGESIIISASSNNHINAMEINKEYGDGNNPVILKSEFILSLVDQICEGTTIGPKEKSIIDRCVSKVYAEYILNGYKGDMPTLKDFKNELSIQPEEEAKNIAVAIERFVDGSFDTFSKETNVNTNSRIISYDILELGESLKSVGMLVVLDSILNRITSNRVKGRNTYIFIDEIYLLFKNQYAANFLFTLWKRVRKYGAYCTGITQNVEDLLQSHTAKTMLANSEFIIMLNQAATDRLELAKLLNISELQLKYITGTEPGEGLLKVGNSLVPFENKFPKDLELYKLMSTKPGEHFEDNKD